MTVTAMPQSGSKAGPEGAAAEEAPAKSKKKLIMILLVLILVGGGGAYWFVLKPKPKEEAPVAGEVVKLDAIQINLSGEHYLRLGLALQLTEKAHEVDGSQALDATIDEFSGRPMAELTDPLKRRELKKALEKELSHLYHGDVMGVYFTEFVTQ